MSQATRPQHLRHASQAHRWLATCRLAQLTLTTESSLSQAKAVQHHGWEAQLTPDRCIAKPFPLTPAPARVVTHSLSPTWDA